MFTVPNRQKRDCMTHITQEQRYTIYSMLAQDYKQDDIAAVIQKYPSIVSRETQIREMESIKLI